MKEWFIWNILKKLWKKQDGHLCYHNSFCNIRNILITNPEGTVKFVSAILGIMFILAGAYKIISYYQNKGKYDIMNYDIAYGIIAIILGIATIAYSDK